MATTNLNFKSVTHSYTQRLCIEHLCMRAHTRIMLYFGVCVNQCPLIIRHLRIHSHVPHRYLRCVVRIGCLDSLLLGVKKKSDSACGLQMLVYVFGCACGDVCILFLVPLTLPSYLLCVSVFAILFFLCLSRHSAAVGRSSSR